MRCPYLISGQCARPAITQAVDTAMQSIPAPSPSGGSTVLQFASGMDITEITVNEAGGPREVSPIGLSNSWWVSYPEDTVDLPMTVIPFEWEQGVAPVVPVSGTITNLYATWELGHPNNYDPEQVGTIHAILAKATSNNPDFFPIPGTRIDFTPTITFDDIYDTDHNALRPVRSGSLSGLSVPVAAGDRLLVVFWITGTPGIYLSSKCGAGVVVG